jgi:hypothetical protein
MPPEQRRYETPIAFAVCALAVLVLAYPALGGASLLNPDSDQYIAGYAFRDFAARSLREGHGVPLWNPFLFGGMPYVAAMHGDIFYPTFLLRLVMPTDAAMTWGMILHVWLAGCFTWLFLRRALGLGFFPSLVGALAYSIGGNVGGLVSPGHDGKIFVSALLPLVLLLVHRCMQAGNRWSWGALVIAVMLAVLTPHPQLLQYLLLVAGAYALFLAFGSRQGDDGRTSPTARHTSLRRLLGTGICVALGMLGGAVQFWPLFEYTPFSPRAGGKEWEHAISYSMPPEELLNTYLPQFSGMLEMYTGRNVIHLHSEYIGAVTLVLAGLAFGLGRANPGARRALWFFTGLFVVSLLWALGGYTPFFSLVYAIVPGTTYFRAPSTMLYVVSFCAATLAAMGVHRALESGVRTRYAIGWSVAALLVMLMALTGGLSAIAETFALEQRAPLVAENRAALVVGAIRSLLFVGVTLGALLLLSRRKLSAGATGWALSALLVADLWSVERAYWRFAPPASVLYAGDAVTTYLQRIPQPGRVLAVAGARMEGAIRDPFLGSGEGKGTGFMVHDIRTVAGYHGNELGRYDELTGWDTPEYLRRVSGPNVLRLLNVRFLYTNAARPANDALPLVAGPVRNAAGNMVYLYELPGDHPYAWIVPLVVTQPVGAIMPTVQDERFDPARVAIFEEGTRVQTVEVPPTLPAPSAVRATVTNWEPGHASFALDAPAPSGAALVVSENWYPGWIATVNGAAAPVARVDGTLIGIGLPAGARTVELTFTSPRYEIGKVISLLVLALGLLGALAGAVLDRRARIPA